MHAVSGMELPILNYKHNNEGNEVKFMEIFL